MKKKTAIELTLLSILLVALLGVWLTTYSEYKPYVRYLLGLDSEPERVEFPGNDDKRKGKEAKLVTPDSIETQYRLPPDRRFLLAAAEIQSLIAGKQAKPPEIRFQNGRWQISMDRREIGTVSELPGYKEWMDLLSAYAAELLKQHPPQTRNANLSEAERKVAALDGIGALKEIDAVWDSKSLNRTVMPVAARASLITVLTSFDQLRLADIVPSRAIALISINNALTENSLPSEDCLLASLLGYRVDALPAAETLPASDPVRLYVMHEDRDLELSASKPGASLLSRYLYLLRLSELGDEKEFQQKQGTLFSVENSNLGLLKLAALVNEFSWNLPVGTSIVAYAKQEVSGNPARKESEILSFAREMLNEQRASLVRSFETEVKQKSEEQRGPLLNAELYRSYYQGHFYSGLRKVGEFYRSELSSVEDTVQFANDLPQKEAGVAGEFKKLYDILSAAKQGKARKTGLMKVLQELTLLGGPAFTDLAYELTEIIPYQHPDTQLLLKLLAERLDTRPDDRGMYAWYVHYKLNDLHYTEKLYSSLSGSTSMTGYAVELAKFMGNRELMKQVLHNSKIRLDNRAWLLYEFGKEEDTTADEMRKEYLRLAAEDAGNSSLCTRYSDYLVDQKRYKDAIQVLEDWINTHDESEGFPYITARARLSEVYYMDKQYEKAWEAVVPVVSSWQGYALARGVLALDRIGKTEEAIRLAKQAVERYPDSPNQLTELLQVLWRHGRYQEAADELKSFKYPISGTHWCWTIAESFAESFSEASEAETLKALDPLLALKHPYPACYSERIEDQGNCSLANAVAIYLNSKKEANLFDLIRTYSCWKKENRAEAGQEWMRSQLDPKKYDKFVQAAVLEREFDLVWTVVTDPDKARIPYLVWLNRAAACATGVCTEEQISELNAFLQSEEAEKIFQNKFPGSYAVAKYLAGLCPLEEVLAEVKHNKTMCFIAFYIGLKAETEGRYADASRWFRTAVETGLTGEFGYSASYSTLDDWRATGRSLSYIQNKRIGLPPASHLQKH